MGLTLRLLRHGATAWSEAGRYCGHTDVGLSPGGRRLPAARRLAEVSYTSVVSSDLRRCRETAAILGFDAELEPALREFDFGALEGFTWEELDTRTRAALLEFDGFVAPGGESMSAFTARVDGFVDGRVDGLHLVITHGGVIRHLLGRAGMARHVAPGEWVDVEVSRR